MLSSFYLISVTQKLLFFSSAVGAKDRDLHIQLYFSTLRFQPLSFRIQATL